MTFDVNTVMAIALGLFVALVARDLLHIALGRFFGIGAITEIKGNTANSSSASGGFQAHRKD